MSISCIHERYPGKLSNSCLEFRIEHYPHQGEKGMMRPLRGEEILLRKDKNEKPWIPLEEMRGMIVCGKCVWVWCPVPSDEFVLSG